MHQYHELLATLIVAGNEKGDRTGTGTRSQFGYQMRFDLQEGFPLVTTKKINFSAVVHELLWFLKGDTNIKYLNDNGVHIWDAWASESGDLGPIYGHQFRKYGGSLEKIPQRKPKLRAGVKPTYLNVGNGSGKEHHPLGKTWEGMMARCYDPKNISYRTYGARGVAVCDAWLEFKTFAEEAPLIPGWNEKEAKEGSVRFVLDKDARGNGFIYSLASCMWLTDRKNQQLNLDTIYTVAKDGVEYSFTNISEFCEEHGAEAKNFSDLWTGNKKAVVRDGFRFVRKEPRIKPIDQIAEVIEQIKDNPNSRRLIVTAWNPADIEDMALPPCHCFFQFYVHNGKLSCQLYQRSADVFIGVPFNIASYALLTHMIADQCGLEVGDFIWTGGDVHLYHNHLTQALWQLGRGLYPLPTLHLAKGVKSIDDYQFEDVKLVNYFSHPHIKAPVAV